VSIWKRIFFGIAGGALAIALLSLPAPLTAWNVGPSCKSANFNSLLNQLWCWLNFNKDSIGPLVQLLGVIGVVVAAVGFFRTQHLNQANAVFQVMKEARDLQLKLDPSSASKITNSRKLWMGINFHASIFQYRHLNFVDETTWKPFEDDLESLVRDQHFVTWLYGKAIIPDFPSADKFDPRFISYLKSIHQCVANAASLP